MMQPGGDLDLGEKAIGAEDGAELRAQNLDRDFTVVAEVARQIDHRHAALADATLDLVASGEGGVELIGGVHSESMRAGGRVRQQRTNDCPRW